jgi:metal-responsive CopG/Arc/MetJ family transcriptional regulator
MRTAKIVSLSLPPEMEREVQKIAKLERRSISEIFREAFRQYLVNRDLTLIRGEGRRIAKRRNLRPKQIAQIVRESRR